MFVGYSVFIYASNLWLGCSSGLKEALENFK